MISIIQVCVILHTTTSLRCKSCNCPPSLERRKTRRVDGDPNVVVLQNSQGSGQCAPEQGKNGKDGKDDSYYDIRTEPPPAPKGGKKKKGCCPYDFDSTNCRTVNDRIQCGYDKNIGRLSPDQIQKELSGGCRLRFGRIECGYWYPPYTNERRPQAWDNPPSVIIQPANYDRPDKQRLKMVKATSRSPSNTRNRKLVSKFINTLQMLGTSKEALRFQKSPETNYVRVPQGKGSEGNQVNCVEIDDRIVCKPI